MSARWLGLAALAALIPAASGCGGTGVSGASQAAGNQLAIYSSLPLQGPAAPVSQQIVNGEKLALSQAGGRAGSFKVGYVSLDDANPRTGRWDPGITASDAKTAAQDTSTIAYLGDYNSAATAVSLPLINAAGILQVSPGSPYQGLTSSLDAGQDEPGRFYPTGRRTFGRLPPGDSPEASAQVQLMRALGVHRIYVLDDQDPFQIPLSEMVASAATNAGIAVAAHDSLSLAPGTLYAGEIEKILRSHPQAVFLAGSGEAGAAALWRQLRAADPGVMLLGSSAMANEAFTSQLGAAEAGAYLTSAALAASLYPSAARRVLSDYRHAFAEDGGPYALYGYETMSVVLDAIKAAGVRGNDRQAVTDRFFSTSNRDSVIGRYSVKPSGETTLSLYGVDRVAAGRPVFYRAFTVG